MRILIHGINFHPEPVGTGKYTGEMAAWLASRGHEIRVVTAPPFNPQWRVAPEYKAWEYSKQLLFVKGKSGLLSDQGTSPDQITVFRCPVWVPKNPRGIKRLFHLVSFALSSFPAMVWQLAWRPDIVLLIQPTLFCFPQCLLVGHWSGAKTWLHIQDFEIDAAFELGDLSPFWAKKWILALERRILSGFDRVSTISDQMVERLVAKEVSRSRCTIFPNWVDATLIYPLSAPSPFRTTLGISENAIVVLYSGSMGKKQGLELLAEAARRLLYRADIQFVFCGEGSYRETFFASASSLPNVSFLPCQPLDGLNDLLNVADIHLLPQRGDAADLVMPSKLTGIFATGRPVIATASPGTQLAAVVEGRGIVVPPADVDALVDGILRLATNASLRKNLGAEARAYAVRCLDLNRILGQFEQAILLLCRKAGGGLDGRKSYNEASETEVPSKI